MHITLSTFNCRGIQDFVKMRKVFHHLRSITNDIIFLQETHSSVNDEKFWKQQWGEHAWFCSHSSNSRGVAILIRNHISPVLNSLYADPNGRYLIMSVTLKGLSLILCNMYAPNEDDPEFFLEVFAKIDQFNQAPLIIAGDFNAVLGPLDYQGSRQKHCNIKASEIISLLMDEYNLKDIWRNFHPNLRHYTRHQSNPRVLSRLDYILISDTLVNNCLNSKISPGVQSDHSVVTLKFKDDQPSKGPGYWKLNCSYLHNDADFIMMVKQKINDFKVDHQNSQCSPNSIWDAKKCTITGVCMEYGARKKSLREKSSKIYFA